MSSVSVFYNKLHAIIFIFDFERVCKTRWSIFLIFSQYCQLLFDGLSIVNLCKTAQRKKYSVKQFLLQFLTDLNDIIFSEFQFAGKSSFLNIVMLICSRREEVQSSLNSNHRHPNLFRGKCAPQLVISTTSISNDHKILFSVI